MLIFYTFQILQTLSILKGQHIHIKHINWTTLTRQAFTLLGEPQLTVSKDTVVSERNSVEVIVTAVVLHKWRRFMFTFNSIAIYYWFVLSL